MKIFKHIAIFIGGTTVGFICGGTFVVIKAIESECIRNSLKKR